MLLLLFRLGPDRYALDAAEIGAVLPLVDIKALPGAPAGVAGVIAHRGQPVPVIDLPALALGRPAREVLSTRIVLTRYDADDGTPHWLGLIAESATETMRRDPADFTEPGLDNPDTPYLGKVATDPQGLIQLITPRRLLPPALREMLFQQLAAAG
jgi:chemotaxis-related protein WspB